MSANDQAAEDSLYVKPIPREQLSGPRAETVQKRNRRVEYLRRHPSYFDGLNHELKAPVLYERLIKQFQTAQERELDGKKKGYGRTLEASLLRGEERVASVDPPINPSGIPSSSGVEESWNRAPAGREDGSELWRQFLTDYFVRGKDEEFDYGGVDGEEALDLLEQEEAEEKWFDDEEPRWASEGARYIEGETGVQDF